MFNNTNPFKTYLLSHNTTHTPNSNYKCPWNWRNKAPKPNTWPQTKQRPEVTDIQTEMKDAHKMDQTKHVTLDTLPVNTPCKITKELPFPQPKKRTNQHCKECKHTNMMTQFKPKLTTNPIWIDKTHVMHVTPFKLRLEKMELDFISWGKHDPNPD